MNPALKPGFAGCALFAAHVHLRRRILAHEHDMESGLAPMRCSKGLGARFDLGSDLLCDRLSAEDLCRHRLRFYHFCGSSCTGSA